MKPPRLTTFGSALVILSSLGLSHYSRAQTQVTVSPADCSGDNTPCTRIVTQQGARAPNSISQELPPDKWPWLRRARG